MEIPSKIKALPAQLRKSAKLHAGQPELEPGCHPHYIKKKKN